MTAEKFHADGHGPRKTISIGGVELLDLSKKTIPRVG